MYHQWTLKDVQKHFSVDFREGLSSKKAISKLEDEGRNSLSEIKAISPLKVLLRQFANFFIVLLIVATILSFFADGAITGFILIIIVLLNIIIGFYQEYKAEKSLEALKKNLSIHAKVIRNKKVIRINAEEIVTGDVVILSEGDKVPADIRLFEESSLRVDEASLTGESNPVSKSIKVMKIETPVADRVNMVFMGTNVVAGRGVGIVVAKGTNTEFGNIAKLVSKEEEKTPIEKMTLRIGRTLTYIAVTIALSIFVGGLFFGENVNELIIFVISILVAAVPESLPTVVTLALAVGVIGMVKKKAIVRRLAVLEAIGRVNVICTDKTGTLTKNKLEVSSVAYFYKNEIKNVMGKYSKEDKAATNILYNAAIVSDASGDKAGEFVGDPLEVAIFETLFKCSKEKLKSRKRFKKESELPFSSDDKFMMVIGKNGGKKVMIAKGIPEKIISFCSLTNSEKKKIREKVKEFSSMGQKTIAVCKKSIGNTNSSAFKGMEFLGVMGFSDELADGVKEAIAMTIKAGIRPIMITGDHPEVARYIYRKLGLKVKDDEIISCVEMDKFSDKELKNRLKTAKIFARVTPENKIQIVEALEEMGLSVAVTGDGVNDAPALKAATVGIAMGIRGNDVSKEASDIILADDNYRSIISAIMYGRTIYDNIKNALVFLLAGNFDEIFLIALAFFLRLPAPLIAIQILWINIVTDSLPSIALAFEDANPKVLSEEPRSNDNKALARSLWYAGTIAFLSFLVGLALYLWGLNHSIAKARTLVFFSVILAELALVFSIRSKKRIWQAPLSFFENKFLNFAVLIALVIQVVTILPSTQKFFGTTYLDNREVAVLFTTVIIIFFGAEIIRWLFDRKTSYKH